MCIRDSFRAESLSIQRFLAFQEAARTGGQPVGMRAAWRGEAVGQLELSRCPDLQTCRAERLTRHSWTTSETDVRKLREAGLDDNGILQLTTLCSYLNFENRVAAALGIAREG